MRSVWEEGTEDEAPPWRVEDPNDSIYLRDEGPKPFVSPTESPAPSAGHVWLWRYTVSFGDRRHAVSDVPDLAAWMERDQVALHFLNWQRSLLPLEEPWPLTDIPRC